MDVTCESCRAQYRVDDAKIPPQGIKAKCPKCGHSFVLRKPEPAAPPPAADAVIAVGDADDAPPPPPPPASAAGGGVPGFGDGSFDAGFGGTPQGFGGTPDGFGGVPDFGASAPPPAPPAAPASASPAFPDFGDVPSVAPDAAPGGSGADPFGTFGAPGGGGVFGGPPGGGGGGVFGGGGFGDGGFEAPGSADGGLASMMGAAKTAFEIRRTDGQEIGPFDMFHIKQMIYEQQLDGSESICDAQGNWVPISSIEELGEIFRLTGATVAPAPAAAAAPAPSFAFTPHESVAGKTDAARMPAKTATSAPMPAEEEAPAPAPVVAAPKRGLSEQILILVERVWALTKIKVVRIILIVLLSAAGLVGVFFVFKKPIYHVLHWDTQIQADAIIAEGDRTIASSESGPLLSALAKYKQALATYPKGANTHGRLAEADSIIWWRDPVRLDLQKDADTQMALGTAISGSDPAILRAKAAVALAKHQLPAAIQSAKEAIAAAPNKKDAVASAILGDALLESGDIPAAQAAYEAAAAGAPARGKTGLARLKIHGGDFAGAKSLADDVLKAEPANGVAQAIDAYAAVHTGGDHDATVKKLHAISADPMRFGQERGRAEYFLGLLAEESGAPGAALAHYRAAVSFYPADGEAVAAARRLFAARFPDRSVDKWLDGLRKVRGSTAMAKILEGEEKYAARVWQQAMSPLLSATTDDPTSARAQVAFGRLEVAIGGDEEKKAKGYFEKALSIDPAYVDAEIELSRWYLASGDAAKARAEGEKAINVDPTRPDAYSVAAEAALAQNDAAAAEQWLRTATDIAPDDYTTWMELGEAMRRASRPADAVAALQKACDLQKESIAPWLGLGRAYEDLPDLQKASDAYAQASKIEPGNIDVRMRDGVVKVKGGDFAAGKRILEGVTHDKLELGEAHFYLGVAYQNTGEPEKAVDSYNQSLKHGDQLDAYLAYFHIGEILAAPGLMHDKDGAREALRQSLKLKPDFYQAHEELAKLAQAENEFDEALKELKAVEEQVVSLPPDQKKPILVRAKLARGRIQKLQTHTKEAEKSFNEVLRLDPRSAEAYFLLGQLYQDTQPGKARTFYLRAIQANPAYAPPYKPAGYMLKDEDKPCAAKKMWEKFLELSTSSDEKKEIQDEVGLLQCE